MPTTPEVQNDQLKLNELITYIKAYWIKKFPENLKNKIQSLRDTSSNISALNQQLIQYIEKFENTNTKLVSNIINLWRLTQSLQEFVNIRVEKIVNRMSPVGIGLLLQAETLKAFNKLIGEIEKTIGEESGEFELEVYSRIKPIKAKFLEFSNKLIQQLDAQLRNEPVTSSRNIQHQELKPETKVSPKPSLSPQSGSPAFFPSTPVPSPHASESDRTAEKTFTQEYSC